MTTRNIMRAMCCITRCYVNNRTVFQNYCNTEDSLTFHKYIKIDRRFNFIINEDTNTLVFFLSIYNKKKSIQKCTLKQVGDDLILTRIPLSEIEV